MLKAKNKFMAIITCLLLTLVLAFGGLVMTTSVAHADGETVTEGETASGLIVKMTDNFGDGWNGATIDVYQDGEVVDNATISEGKSATWTFASYDEMATYVFVWNKGSFDVECSFIIEVNGTEKFRADSTDCSAYTDGQNIFVLASSCEHSFEEGSAVCVNCNRTCGNEFSHSFVEDTTCDVCGYECGVRAGHDWSNSNGVCGMCAFECAHTFEGLSCTICNFTYAATVITEGESESVLYVSIFEAFENATNDATVKLLSNISVCDYVDIVNKTLIIDLNGYTWMSSSWAMYVQGTSNVTITDTSEKKDGVLCSTNAATPTVILGDEATLELAEGTIRHSMSNPINISHSGNPVEAHFVMTGGKLQGNGIIAEGNSVTIKGGVLDIQPIFLMKGDLDLSEYPNPVGIKVDLGSDFSAIGTISLPENYALLDENGESAFVEWGSYTVTHTACEYDNACDGNCNICLQDTRTPTAHTGGTASCIEQAVCTVCGVSYGELAEHEYDNACDGNCNVCLEDTREPAEHTGGTASCIEQAVCTVCGVSYGELAEHEYDNACDGNCNVCEEDTREPAEHVDEDKNGKCDVCEATVPVEPDSSIESSVPETSDSETSDASSESTAPVTSDSEEESGCSSMIDGVSMAALALIVLAFIVKKRKGNYDIR